MKSFAQAMTLSFPALLPGRLLLVEEARTGGSPCTLSGVARCARNSLPATYLSLPVKNRAAAGIRKAMAAGLDTCLL
ncbi:MAG: hypothetical protein AB9873_12825 [Syntrophobacteraceae bacterium]